MKPLPVSVNVPVLDISRAWLLSLSVTCSRSIRAVASVGASLLFTADRVPRGGGHMVCVCSPDLQVGCFHPLAVVDPAAVEIGVQMPVEAPVFSSLGYTPESGIAGS